MLIKIYKFFSCLNENQRVKLKIQKIKMLNNFLFREAINLVLVRHSEVIDPSILYGQIDIELSLKGKKDSEKLVEKLSFYKWDKIFVSPLKRTLYPAKLLAERLNIPLVQVEEIKEINFGEWAGKPIKELSQNPVFWERYKDPENIAPPNGETLKDLRKRVRSFLERIKKEEKGNFLVFSHAGVIKAVFCEIFNLPSYLYFSLNLNYSSISIFNFFPDGIFTLSLWNADLLSE